MDLTDVAAGCEFTVYNNAPFPFAGGLGGAAGGAVPLIELFRVIVSADAANPGGGRRWWEGADAAERRRRMDQAFAAQFRFAEAAFPAFAAPGPLTLPAQWPMWQQIEARCAAPPALALRLAVSASDAGAGTADELRVRPAAGGRPRGQRRARGPGRLRHPVRLRQQRRRPARPLPPMCAARHRPPPLSTRPTAALASSAKPLSNAQEPVRGPAPHPPSPLRQPSSSPPAPASGSATARSSSSSTRRAARRQAPASAPPALPLLPPPPLLPQQAGADPLAAAAPSSAHLYPAGVLERPPAGPRRPPVRRPRARGPEPRRPDQR